MNQTIMESAKMVFIRKQRFIDGYSIDEQIEQLLLYYFGDINKLQQDGLVKYYHLLKQYVIENKIIGLILYGKDISKDKIIIPYITNKNKTIHLTIQSICNCLLTEYFDNDTILDLCKDTPGFDIYYKTLNK